MKGIKDGLANHLRQHLGLYLVITVIYLAGVAFGSLGVGALQPQNQQELAGFVQKSFSDLSAGNIPVAIKDLLWENLKALVVVYVLGMTVIGMPLVFALVFTRGFVLGFAVGFIIQVNAWQGILVALAGILPPALINIPVLITTAVFAITFSLNLVRGSKGWQERSLGKQLAAYSGYILLMACFGGLAALIQGYVSPFMLKIILAYTSIQ